MLLAFPVLAVCPLAQSQFNRHFYSDSSIRAGMGWHLWNRITFTDGSIPPHSETLRRMAPDLARRGLSNPVTQDYWWGVCQRLSGAGYTRQETDDFCRSIALEGLREHPWFYVANTAWLSLRMLFEPVLPQMVFFSYDQYLEAIKVFGGQDPHRRLMTQELLAYGDACTLSRVRNPIAAVYLCFSFIFEQVAAPPVQAACSALYLMGFLRAILAFRREPQRAMPLVMLGIVPLIVITGSCMTEEAVVRYKVPVLPLILLFACATAEDGLERLRRATGSRSGASSHTASCVPPAEPPLGHA